MDFKLLNKNSGKDLKYTNQDIAEWLHEHLEEFGDKVPDIVKALDYVFDPHRGGFILLGLDGEEIAGVVVINETGMSGYIPENILVYIAIHKDMRGKGYGKELMQNAIRLTKGGVALHVEADNPAVFLYKKMGFTNKYLEMRLQKD